MRTPEPAGCKELHPETVDDINMLIEKEWWHLSKVFISPQELWYKCRWCENTDVCCKKHANMLFLALNYDKWLKKV